MLRLIPPRLHRAMLRAAHGLRKAWWRARRPRIRGCRALALDAEGRVLLIRHSYGAGTWTLPGGGVGRGECPVAAAVRELREETGCTLEQPREVAAVEQPLHGASNLVHVVAGTVRGTPVPDGREIVAAAFFAPGALPSELNARLRGQLPGWIRAAEAGLPPPGPPPASAGAPPPPAPRA